MTLAADPAAPSPNLDLKLSLFGVTDGSVAVDNPLSKAGTPSRDVVTGMDATVSATVAEDWYFVAVEGVGNGSPSNGYDGYASVGAYTLSVTGSCQSNSAELPSAPQAVQASTAGSSATVAWAAPASTGTSSITNYVVTREGAATVTVTGQSRNYTFTDLPPGANDTSRSRQSTPPARAPRPRSWSRSRQPNPDADGSEAPAVARPGARSRPSPAGGRRARMAGRRWTATGCTATG